jgi:hypothetical protein
MKPSVKTGCFTVVALCVLAGLIVAVVLHRNYYAEYNVTKSAAVAAGFRVSKAWLYDEDLTLEDFGLYLTRGDLKLWLDIRYASDVRGPDARISGIALQSVHEGYPRYERIYRFDSDFWKSQGLPLIHTLNDFLRNAESIWPVLLASKSEVPASESQYHEGQFRTYLILRDDPEDVAPVHTSMI